MWYFSCWFFLCWHRLLQWTRQVNLLSETIYGSLNYDEHPRLIEIKNDKLLINGVEADDHVAIKD